VLSAPFLPSLWAIPVTFSLLVFAHLGSLGDRKHLPVPKEFLSYDKKTKKYVSHKHKNWSTKGHAWCRNDKTFLRHNAGDIRYLFLEPSLRDSLGTGKCFLSPSDPRCAKTNNENVTGIAHNDGRKGADSTGFAGGWGTYFWNSSSFHQNGISYAVHKNGDDLKGSGSITFSTRNNEGSDPGGDGSVKNPMGNLSHNWKKSHRSWKIDGTWAGPGDNKAVVMSGLDKGQGQMAFADGVVQQQDDTQMQAAMVANAKLEGGTAEGAGARPKKTHKDKKKQADLQKKHPHTNQEVTSGTWY
jgi:hypothetical protein